MLRKMLGIFLVVLMISVFPAFSGAQTLEPEASASPTGSAVTVAQDGTLAAQPTEGVGTDDPQPAVKVTVTQNNYIELLKQMEENPAAYAGQTVSIEGMFGTFHYGEGDDQQTYYQVYRYMPGDCCAVDYIGLEVLWPEGSAQPYPADGAWVSAEGKLETYELDGTTYLQARLTSLEVLRQPGKVFVTQE